VFAVGNLVRRYEEGDGDPYGRAVITAAMDASRFGHASPLPGALLVEAAGGYLTGAQRDRDVASWGDAALGWAAGMRGLKLVPDGSGYEVAGELDQHGRRTRQDQIGPRSLWDAVVAHPGTANDLESLAQAARDRGLYRHAAALWTAGQVSLDDLLAIGGLLGALGEAGESAAVAALLAREPAAHASPRRPDGRGQAADRAA
jgi:hypothetical protein